MPADDDDPNGGSNNFKLRRKLGDDAESPRYLITAYGVGYTLGTFTSYAPESRKTARALR